MCGLISGTISETSPSVGRSVGLLAVLALLLAVEEMSTVLYHFDHKIWTKISGVQSLVAYPAFLRVWSLTEIREMDSLQSEFILDLNQIQ